MRPDSHVLRGPGAEDASGSRSRSLRRLLDRAAKGALDRVVAFVLLLLMAPLILAVIVLKVCGTPAHRWRVS